MSSLYTQECFKSYPEVYSKYTEDEEETMSTDVEDNKSTNNNNN